MQKIALAGLVLLASPALADKPMTQHFGGKDSCYERSYSAAHLAKHPLQRVTHMRLTHYPRYSGPFGADDKPMIYPDAPEIVVNLSVRMRGSDDWDLATGFCWPEGDGMACGLECDGGQFSLADRGTGKILLRIQDEIYFHDCDSGDGVLSSKPDDKSFLLHRLDDSACTAPD